MLSLDVDTELFLVTRQKKDRKFSVTKNRDKTRKIRKKKEAFEKKYFLQMKKNDFS